MLYRLIFASSMSVWKSCKFCTSKDTRSRKQKKKLAHRTHKNKHLRYKWKSEHSSTLCVNKCVQIYVKYSEYEKRKWERTFVESNMKQMLLFKFLAWRIKRMDFRFAFQFGKCARLKIYSVFMSREQKKLFDGDLKKCNIEILHWPK